MWNSFNCYRITITVTNYIVIKVKINNINGATGNYLLLLNFNLYTITFFNENFLNII